MTATIAITLSLGSGYALARSPYPASASRAASRLERAKPAPEITNPLVVPAVVQLTGTSVLAAAQEANIAGPQAKRLRAESQTKFDGLSAPAAATVAREAFPGLVAQPSAGAPPLPAGAGITGYPTDNAASVELAGGKHALVESSTPLAMETSPGRREALDLALKEDGGSFQAVRSPLSVQIPRASGQAVVLPDSGVTLTPVDAGGQALHGSAGQIDGSSVFYGGTGTNMDTLVKPTFAGVELDALLRGASSPRRLYIKVGLPPRAKLVQARSGSDRAEILEEGAPVVTVAPPAAEDAAGTAVPVSMAVKGDELELSVEAAPASIRYPLAIDPRAEEHQLWETASGRKSNWVFTSEHGVFKEGGCRCGEQTGKEEGVLTVSATNVTYEAGEGGAWIYQTHGDSDIFEFTATTELSNYSTSGPNDIGSYLELDDRVGEGGSKADQEGFKELMNDVTQFEGTQTDTICPYAEARAGAECEAGSGHEHNSAEWGVAAGKRCEGCTLNEALSQTSILLYETSGGVSTEFSNTQEKLPFETEVEGKKVDEKRTNVLGPEGGWLSESQGAIEGIALGKGIGVSAARLEYEYESGRWERLPGLERNYYTDGLCHGVQCTNTEGPGGITEQREIFALPMVAQKQRLPNGEDHIRWRAEDMMSESQSTDPQGEATVKVETSKPHSISLAGLPPSGELSERAYEVTASATDGESPLIASSGIRRITLFIKGNKLETKEGGEASCEVPKGECTAHAKFKIPAERLGEGPAQLVVEAENNAGNTQQEPFSVTVHHSAPVSLGPGSLDLQSGDFSVGASDVSMAGGLTVSRTYSSRDTTAGAPGTLGPQWLLSIGGEDESIEELYGGAMMLIGSDGKETVFTPKEKLNAKGEPERNAQGEIEYIHNGRGEREFESPAGDANIELTGEEQGAKEVALYLTDPSAGNQVKFKQPTGSPEGAKRWMPTVGCGHLESDTASNPFKCAESDITTFAYQYVAPETTEYGLPSGSKPEAVVEGQDGNLYETDQGTNSIDVVSPSGKVTQHSLPQGSHPAGITAGPDGNVWFTDLESGRIGKITPAGNITEHALLAGAKEPNSIAEGPEGDLWFTEAGANRIGRITTSFEVKEWNLAAGSDPGAIVEGPGNDMWFTETGSSKIGYVKPNTGETFEEELKNRESHPNGITVGPEGDLWFADWRNGASGDGAVSRMTPEGKFSEYNAPSGFGDPYDIAKGPEGSIYFTDASGARIGKVSPSTGKASVAYFLQSGSDALGIASGPEAALWYVNASGSPALGKLTTGGAKPIEALAPKPAGANCPENGVFTSKAQSEAERKQEEEERGCRALTFKYATSTSATGEAEEEWRSYKGDLEAVSFVAWNAKEKKMEPPIEVAHYLYDKQGRLRAEYDPRTEPKPLKTLYGYDSEGHVTALKPAGQQPWIFTYGTSKADASPGRLVKLMRPSASKAMWKGEGPPVDPESQPALEGSPVVGNRMGVTDGVWYGEPAAYGYQWERCNAEGEACVPIAGANNENYTPLEADAGHRLRAQVSATNAGGSTALLTPASALVEIPAAQGGITEYSLPGESNPYGITVGHEGNLWFTAGNGGGETAKIGEITPGGKIGEFTLSEKTSQPTGITAGSEGNLWFTLTASRKIGRLVPGEGKISEYPLEKNPIAQGDPYAITPDGEGNLWFTEQAEAGSGRIGKIAPATYKISEYELPAKQTAPDGITLGPEGDLWYTDASTGALGKLNTAGQISQYTSLGEGKGPDGIATDAKGNIWFTEFFASKIGEIAAGAGPPPIQYSVGGQGPGAITVGREGDAWFTLSESAANKIGRLTPQGQVSEYVLPGSGDANQLAAGPEGDIWITEGDPARIDRVNPYLYTGPTPTPAAEHAPQEGTSVQYGVSVSDYQASTAYESVHDLYPPESAWPLGGDTVASNGDIWVADTGASRVDELSPSGQSLGYVGSSEAPFVNAGCSEAMCMPMGVTTNAAGDLWVINANGDLQEWHEGKRLHNFRVSPSSVLLISWALPWGIAVEGGHVFVSFELEGVVKEYSEAGAYIKTIGSQGSGEGQFAHPEGLAAADGTLYVADGANDRVEECVIETGECHIALGHASFGDGRIQSPSALALEANGDLWVADESGSHVAKFSPKGEYLEQYGDGAPAGRRVSGARGIALSAQGALVIANWEAPLLVVSGQALETLGEQNGLQPMDENAVAAWAQGDIPVEGTAVIPPQEPQGWPATSYKRATVYYLDDPGRLVNVSSPSNSHYGAISTTEYNQYNDMVRELSPENRIRALEAGNESAVRARLLSTESKYDGEGGEKTAVAQSEPGTELIEKIGPQHMVKLQSPEEGLKEELLARERTVYSYDTEVIYNNETGRDESREPPNEGETYHLLTATQTFADLEDPVLKNPQVEVRTTTTSYTGQGDLGFKLREPTSVTTDPQLQDTKNPLNIKHETIYSPTTGQVTETRGPALKLNSAHDEQTIYYTAEANPEKKHQENRCGERPEWAGLVCLTIPTREPKVGSVSVPGLPEVRTVSYNIYDQPEEIEEAFKTENAKGEVVNATTRTKTLEYDRSGRAKTTRVTSTAPEKEAKKLSPVTYGYSETTGAQISETAEGGITAESVFNSLGQLTEYKDGTGNIAHFEYDEQSGLLKEMSDSAPAGGKGVHQRYTYNQTTGTLIGLEDSQAGTFTASYDGAGQLTSELYPDGVCANYAYDEVEEATHLEYVKSSSCKPGTDVWYSETIHPSVHGEVLADENTLTSTAEKFDAAGRVERVEETPTGEGCTTELFVYEAESNREKQTRRAPEANGQCASKGGEEQSHSYDEGNRFTDPGTEYNSLADITKMPEADAGGKVLESAYYVDGQVATQSQNGQTNAYTYGPSGRVIETSSESVTTQKKTISQYDGPGSSVAWTCEGSAGKCEGAAFTRNIPGIDGALSALDTNGTVTFQLHDLKGDIVETAENNPTESEPASKQPSTAFGVPAKGEGKPQKFAFLGAAGIASELPESGAIVQGGTAYVPQSAITLQAEGVSPPGLPEGSGPLVKYTLEVEPWAVADAHRSAGEQPGREATAEREAAEAACKANLAACVGLPAADPIVTKHCEVSGGLGQVAEYDGHRSEPWVEFTCAVYTSHALIAACLQGVEAALWRQISKECYHEGPGGPAYVLIYGKANEHRVNQIGFNLNSFQCDPRMLYRLIIGYWQPGYASWETTYGSWTECKIDGYEYTLLWIEGLGGPDHNE